MRESTDSWARSPRSLHSLALIENCSQSPDRARSGGATSLVAAQPARMSGCGALAAAEAAYRRAAAATAGARLALDEVQELGLGRRLCRIVLPRIPFI